MMIEPPDAPELVVREWLNTSQPLSLKALRGKVVLIKAFQMLCPGCVSHALPQAQRVAQIFSSDDVAVIGLHSVFEHHKAQGSRDALEAFLHEYRINFPVGIDMHRDGHPLPTTMSAYGMQGTPTTLLINRQGALIMHQFGLVDDLVLGAKIGDLLQGKNQSGEKLQQRDKSSDCDASGCTVAEHTK